MDDLLEPSALTNRFLLDAANTEAFNRYETLLQRSLADGEGECLIEIGVPFDDEYEANKGFLIDFTSLSSVDRIGLTKEELDVAEIAHNVLCEKLNCVSSSVLTRPCDGGRFSRVVLVRRVIPEEDFIEVRVAVVGNVDAGKSTFLSVITVSWSLQFSSTRPKFVLQHNVLDDGRGTARRKLFRLVALHTMIKSLKR